MHGVVHATALLNQFPKRACPELEVGRCQSALLGCVDEVFRGQLPKDVVELSDREAPSFTHVDDIVTLEHIVDVPFECMQEMFALCAAVLGGRENDRLVHFRGLVVDTSLENFAHAFEAVLGESGLGGGGFQLVLRVEGERDATGHEKIEQLVLVGCRRWRLVAIDVRAARGRGLAGRERRDDAKLPVEGV